MTDLPALRYVATLTYSYQDGPDTTAKEPRHKVVTAETTVGELMAWYSSYFPYTGKAGAEKFPGGPVTIMEADHEA